MSTYATTRQLAAQGVLPEHYLRQKIKRGEAIGFYSGNRFYWSVEALAAQLEAECAANANRGQQDERGRARE